MRGAWRSLRKGNSSLSVCVFIPHPLGEALGDMAFSHLFQGEEVVSADVARSPYGVFKQVSPVQP